MKYQPDFPLNYANSNAMETIVRNHEQQMYAQNELHCTFEKVDNLRPQIWRNFNYKIGDPVLVRNHKRIYKTEPEFLEKYIIMEKVNDYSYLVKNLETDRVTKLHINDVKLDVTRATNLDNEEDEKEDGI